MFSSIYGRPVTQLFVVHACACLKNSKSLKMERIARCLVIDHLCPRDIILPFFLLSIGKQIMIHDTLLCLVQGLKF
jgi:hypothetical protein